MSDLLIVMFDTEDAAARLNDALRPLRDAQRLETQDTAIAKRDTEGVVKIDTPGNVPLAQTIGGTVWGAILGAAFMMPVAGAVMGAGAGAVVGQLRDPNLDSAFIEDIARNLPPGGSALCLWVRRVDGPALREVVERFDTPGHIVQSPLGPEDEVRLQSLLEQ